MEGVKSSQQHSWHFKIHIFSSAKQSSTSLNPVSVIISPKSNRPEFTPFIVAQNVIFLHPCKHSQFVFALYLLTCACTITRTYMNCRTMMMKSDCRPPPRNRFGHNLISALFSRFSRPNDGRNFGAFLLAGLQDASVCCWLTSGHNRCKQSLVSYRILSFAFDITGCVAINRFDSGRTCQSDICYWTIEPIGVCVFVYITYCTFHPFWSVMKLTILNGRVGYGECKCTSRENWDRLAAGWPRSVGVFVYVDELISNLFELVTRSTRPISNPTERTVGCLGMWSHAGIFIAFRPMTPVRRRICLGTSRCE